MSTDGYLIIPHRDLCFKDMGGRFIGWIDKAKNRAVALALVKHYKELGIICLIRKERL